MKNTHNFDHYYRNELCHFEEKYIKEAKKCIMMSIFMSMFFAIVTAALCIWQKNIYFACSAFSLIIIWKAYKAKYKYIETGYKKDMLRKTMDFLSDKGAFISENGRISRQSVDECELFNTDKLTSTGNNYMLMTYKQFGIAISDLSLFYRDSKLSEKYVFDGVYFSATFNKPIREQTYIIPNNIKDVLINNAMNYYDYAGTRVVLENNEFEKKYNVYSVDELQARYIISLKLMERVNDIDKIFPGKKYIVFKKTGKISILFSGESIEKKLNDKVRLSNSDSRFKFCEEIFNYFNKFLEVYKILDLENRLYMMEV